MPTDTDTISTPAQPIGTPVPARDPFIGAGADDYDAIAELFLGGDSATTPQARSADSSGTTEQIPAPCEYLLLGHLPGTAAPWPAQYAAAFAANTGERVGLIKLDSGIITVDLVGEPALASPAPTLDDAVRTLRRRAGRTLIVSNDAATIRPGPHGRPPVTVITGADEAAIVAAYRMIRSLSSAVGAVTLAVMGADDAAAERVHRQVSDAAAGFLSSELALGPSVRRVGTIPRVNLYRGEDPRSIGDIIAALSARTDQDENPPDSLLPAHTHAPTAIKIQPDSATAQRDAPPTPNLHASRIAGLTLIESRCPYHEQLELAADAAGALAIVSVGGVETVAELLAAKTWAKDHARLLAKAESSLTNQTADPTLHLMTDRPAAARGLIGSGVRVHVLARASADGWACLPLDEQ